MVKTNAMRLLEQAGIAFSVREYPVDEEHLDGMSVASACAHAMKTRCKIRPRRLR